MARLNLEQAASFPNSSGGTSFLSLQNDGDSAKVRFAYNSYQDIITDSVHDAKNNEGKFRQVSCLRHSNEEPFSVCPMCAAGSPIKKVIYFNVRNEETGEMQVWQRSEAYFRNNLLPLFQDIMNDYPNVPLCSIPFKITRNGAKGDHNTKYVIRNLQPDGMTLDQFPEEIDPEEKGIIKKFSFDQLQNYVNTGVYPEEGNKATNANQAVNANQAEVRPRDSYNNFGQPARVENCMNNGQQYSSPMNTNRRTMNNGGF